MESGHADQLVAVFDALDAGVAPPVTLADTRRTMEFVAALYASAFTGERVHSGQIGPDSPFAVADERNGSPMGSGAHAMTLHVDHALGRSVTVSAGDVSLFTYVYRPDTPRLESPKPYLHPIRSLAGDEVSLFRPHDHVWHKGIAWSLPHVGEHNFWGGPTYVHGSFYVQLENNGSAVHRAMTGLCVTDSAASLSPPPRLDLPAGPAGHRRAALR